MIRDNITVLDAWKSNLSWRCQVTVKVQIIGYNGQTGPQKHFAENKEVSQDLGRLVESLKEFRMGGFNQIVIPRFKTVDEERDRRNGLR